MSEAKENQNENLLEAENSSEVTKLLGSWRAGDENALEKLVPIVYGELHRIAGNYLRRESSDHTLQPTALVNEAFIRLTGAKSIDWQNRQQFFGIAANLMRQILVSHARTKYAQKRGGDENRAGRTISLDDALEIGSERDRELILLDEALKGLAAIDERASRVVELRYFVGLTIEETAEVLNLSPMTVKREWATARAWLHREMTGE